MPARRRGRRQPRRTEPKIGTVPHDTASKLRGLDAQQQGGLGMQLEGPTAAGLMYSYSGGDGPVVVLLHGVLMNGTLWDTVVADVRDRYRCIVPELPFGAHPTPMPDDADLSLPALATMIAGFLTELDLRHVTLVCNDPPSPSAPCRSGGFPRASSGVGSIRCATTPRSAATSTSTSAPSPSPSSCSSGPTSSAPSPARSSSSGRDTTSSCPRPHQTTRSTLPEHTTRVDRRHPHPHPHRPTTDPDRPMTAHRVLLHGGSPRIGI